MVETSVNIAGLMGSQLLQNSGILKNLQESGLDQQKDAQNHGEQRDGQAQNGKTIEGIVEQEQQEDEQENDQD